MVKEYTSYMYYLIDTIYFLFIISFSKNVQFYCTIVIDFSDVLCIIYYYYIHYDHYYT